MPDTDTGIVAPDPRSILIDGLWEDPRTRPLIAQAIETKHPGSVPGFGLSKLQQQVQAEADRAKLLNDNLEKDQNARVLARERQAVIEEGLTAADVPEVEKLMSDELYGTHKIAARELRRRRQETIASGSRGRPGSWERPGQDKTNNWFSGVAGGPGIKDDRRTWSKDRAYEILHDFERQRSVGAM